MKQVSSIFSGYANSKVNFINSSVWRLGVVNSRLSELSTASVSLVDSERTSDCAGSLCHFLISGSGSNQS